MPYLNINAPLTRVEIEEGAFMALYAYPNGAGATLTISDALDNRGTIYRKAGSGLNVTDIDSGRVTYVGLGGIVKDYSADDYHDLEINSAGETFSLAAGLHVTGDLIISAGTLDASTGNAIIVDGDVTIQPGALLHVQNAALTVHGSIGGGGTLTADSSTVTVDGDLSANTYNGTSGLTSVGGDWGISGYTNNNGDVSLTGAGSISPAAFYSLTVTGGAYTLSGDVSVSVDLTVNSSLGTGTHTLSTTDSISGTGTLTGGSGLITAGGDFTVANYTATSGTTSVGGAWDVSGTFEPGNGTVVFTGASSDILLGTSFNNLSIAPGTELSNSGGSIVIGGTFDNQGVLVRTGGDSVSRMDFGSGTVATREQGEPYRRMREAGTTIWR